MAMNAYIFADDTAADEEDYADLVAQLGSFRSSSCRIFDNLWLVRSPHFGHEDGSSFFTNCYLYSIPKSARCWNL
jgi:hypothetical protein